MFDTSRVDSNDRNASEIQGLEQNTVQCSSCWWQKWDKFINIAVRDSKILVLNLSKSWLIWHTLHICEYMYYKYYESFISLSVYVA